MLPKIKKTGTDGLIRERLTELSDKYKYAWNTKSKFNPVVLHHYLKDHPDGDVHFEAWTVGFSLGLKEDLDMSLLSKEIHNVIDSKDDLLEMLDRLEMLEVLHRTGHRHVPAEFAMRTKEGRGDGLADQEARSQTRLVCRA